jgi:probable rRNA maturation factor
MIEVEVFDLRTGTLRENQTDGEEGDSRLSPPGPGRRLPGWRPREVVGEAPSLAELRRLSILAAASAGIRDGHLAIEFVDARRIAKLNAEHRGEPGPTDVLSFPIDGVAQLAEHGTIVAPDAGVRRGAIDCGDRELGDVDRELGDVVICPEQTVDVREAVVHGVLHLVGMDHESDDGEMLALQRELLARENE